MPDAPLLQAESLVKHFGELAAVQGVSFSVRQGECLGLLGPNGAGKTTIIRMLYGICTPTAGRLRIFGLDTRTDLRAIKTRTGICQQEDNLDPDLSVRENLRVYGRYFNLDEATVRQRIEELLRRMQLEAKADASVLTLSGGMKRRLMLARALLAQPELLILDEPTTGLDPQSRHSLWRRLEELKRAGLTLLLTTHYMEEAAQLCDRLVIIDHGRLLVEGHPCALIAEHAGHRLAEVQEPDDALRQWLREEAAEFDDLGYRLVIYARRDPAIFDRLRAAHPGHPLTLRPATLEDVFLRLTGRELRE